MPYSYENTIIVFSRDKALIEMSRKVALAIKINAAIAKHYTDIYAIPSFFIIIDGKYANKDFLTVMEDMLGLEDPKEFGILINGKPAFPPGRNMKKFIINESIQLTASWLKTTILNKHLTIIRHKNNKRSYDRTIFRVIFILRKFIRNKEAVLKLQDLCNEFNVSEKTIKRDISLLKAMGEDIIYDKKRKGFVLVFSTLDIVQSDD